MTDVDTVIADYHAGRAERDPYDDLGVLIAEVERLRAQRQAALDYCDHLEELCDGYDEDDEAIREILPRIRAALGADQ